MARLWDRGVVSWPHFRDLQQHARTLQSVAVWSRRSVIVGGETDLVEALQVGRSFARSDIGGASVVIVSQDLARRAFYGDPVGRRLRFNQRWFTIIGVVPDIELRQYTEPTGPAFYLYSDAVPAFGAYEILVRASGDPRALIPALRSAVTQFDNSLAFATLETMDTLMGETVAHERISGYARVVFRCRHPHPRGRGPLRALIACRE